MMFANLFKLMSLIVILCLVTSKNLNKDPFEALGIPDINPKKLMEDLDKENKKIITKEPRPKLNTIEDLPTFLQKNNLSEDEGVEILTKFLIHDDIALKKIGVVYDQSGFDGINSDEEISNKGTEERLNQRARSSANLFFRNKYPKLHYEAYGAEAQYDEIVPNWRIFKVLMIGNNGESTFLRICLPMYENLTALVSEKEELCAKNAKLVEKEKEKNEDYISKIKGNNFFKKVEKKESPNKIDIKMSPIQNDNSNNNNSNYQQSIQSNSQQYSTNSNVNFPSNFLNNFQNLNEVANTSSNPLLNIQNNQVNPMLDMNHLLSMQINSVLNNNQPFNVNNMASISSLEKSNSANNLGYMFKQTNNDNLNVSPNPNTNPNTVVSPMNNNQITSNLLNGNNGNTQNTTLTNDFIMNQLKKLSSQVENLTSQLESKQKVIDEFVKQNNNVNKQPKIVTQNDKMFTIKPSFSNSNLRK